MDNRRSMSSKSEKRYICYWIGLLVNYLFTGREKQSSYSFMECKICGGLPFSIYYPVFFLIDFASSRGYDLTGAHNYYDLWVFDQSHEPKDSRVFHNKANVPIVMIANKLQASMRDLFFRARYIKNLIKYT